MLLGFVANVVIVQSSLETTDAGSVSFGDEERG